MVDSMPTITGGGLRCYNCGEVGHLSRDCHAPARYRPVDRRLRAGDQTADRPRPADRLSEAEKGVKGVRGRLSAPAGTPTRPPTAAARMGSARRGCRILARCLVALSRRARPGSMGQGPTSPAWTMVVTTNRSLRLVRVGRTTLRCVLHSKACSTRSPLGSGCPLPGRCRRGLPSLR